jgi:hypothetical protein
VSIRPEPDERHTHKIHLGSGNALMSPNAQL